MKMAEGAETYLKHLEAEGKSPSTCGTARRTLALLTAHFGADSDIGSLCWLSGYFVIHRGFFSRTSTVHGNARATPKRLSGGARGRQGFARFASRFAPLTAAALPSGWGR